MVINNETIPVLYRVAIYSPIMQIIYVTQRFFSRCAHFSREQDVPIVIIGNRASLYINNKCYMRNSILESITLRNGRWEVLLTSDE